ncbi:iron(III) transport system ATP-binding protein [Nakamurella sp. UYEF19]|uniref:ABC transporter ATP-binding protein n=1 Tax=Nakamurella sp. UYEF19 TaxID=1756392 RepID=UPI0033991695
MSLLVAGLQAAHGSRPTLFDIDLSVPDHALACVVGPSGCGKTTLLRVIAGFHTAAAGRVELNGRVLDQPPGVRVPAERRSIGYIPQDGALFPHLSVAANIGFGLPRADRAAAVARLLELIDLVGLADRHPHQLSGGQQQRVALARALAPEPDLLLLDEPFTALDAGLRARVRTDVVDLLRSTGTAAVLVTHDPAEALAIADQVTIMASGRIVQTASPAELHARPVSSAAARALGDTNLIAGLYRSRSVSTALGELLLDRPVLADAATCGAPTGQVTVVVRPRQVVLCGGDEPGAVAALVRRQEFRGEDHRLELMVDGVPDPLVCHSPSRVALDSTVHVRVAGAVHPLIEPVVPSAATI